MKTYKNLITTREAAKILGLSMYTLRKWACMGGPIYPVIKGRRNPLWWSLRDVEQLAIERAER